MCAIHEAVSGKARLRIDANQGWTVKDTLWISSELASLGVELIEQPVAAGDFEGLREIRTHSPILIAADESCHGIRDAMRLAAALDIIREVDLDSVYILAQEKVSGGFDHLGGKAVLWDAPGIGCTVKGESE